MVSVGVNVELAVDNKKDRQHNPDGAFDLFHDTLGQDFDLNHNLGPDKWEA